jgi:hypothetical protein
MKLPIYLFLLVVGLPIWAILWTAPEQTLRQVAEESIGAVAVFALLLFAPRLLRRLFGRRTRRPSARAAGRLDWPASLTNAEMETFCLAWLRAHGWMASYATDAEAESTYLTAVRGQVVLTVLCDTAGEAMIPVTLRTFAQTSARLRATVPVVVTLSRAALPHPATEAARAAGVRLLRVAELAQLDALAEAPAPQAVAPAAA